MTFEEFNDQAFELIEREAFDPKGVQEILAATPEYREGFEKLKAALALADHLPVVEPPSGLDAMILAFFSPV